MFSVLERSIYTSTFPRELCSLLYYILFISSAVEWIFTYFTSEIQFLFLSPHYPFSSKFCLTGILQFLLLKSLHHAFTLDIFDDVFNQKTSLKTLVRIVLWNILKCTSDCDPFLLFIRTNRAYLLCISITHSKNLTLFFCICVLIA